MNRVFLITIVAFAAFFPVVLRTSALHAEEPHKAAPKPETVIEFLVADDDVTFLNGQIAALSSQVDALREKLAVAQPRLEAAEKVIAAECAALGQAIGRDARTHNVGCFDKPAPPPTAAPPEKAEPPKEKK